MTTDGPDPTPCDMEIFAHGTPVFITHSIPSNAMERWVVQIREVSGQRVAWSFMGGRAVIRAIGDLALVRDAILESLPEHDRLYKAAMDALGSYGFRGHAGCWITEDGKITRRTD